MTDSNTLAQAITAAHAAGFTGFPPQLVPAPASDAPVYLGALQACSTLGFIAHDAQVLAHAWQSRWQRTGSTTPAIWPTVAQDFGLQARPHAAPFAACPKQLGLYAVLPDAAWVGRMARAGVPTVQLRFKSDDPAAIAREVRAAVDAVADTPALLFINDHWREAIAAGAYGAHLGQEDLDALSTAQVQELRQSGLRLGVSTHGYAEMLRLSHGRHWRHWPGAVCRRAGDWRGFHRRGAGAGECARPRSSRSAAIAGDASLIKKIGFSA